MSERDIKVRLRECRDNKVQPLWSDFTAWLARIEALEAERDEACHALARVSGALMDAGDIPVPVKVLGYGEAIEKITAQRDALRAQVGPPAEEIGQAGQVPQESTMSIADHYGHGWRAGFEAGCRGQFRQLRRPEWTPRKETGRWR